MFSNLLLNCFNIQILKANNLILWFFLYVDNSLAFFCLIYFYWFLWCRWQKIYHLDFYWFLEQCRDTNTLWWAILFWSTVLCWNQNRAWKTLFHNRADFWVLNFYLSRFLTPCNFFWLHCKLKKFLFRRARYFTQFWTANWIEVCK